MLRISRWSGFEQIWICSWLEHTARVRCVLWKATYSLISDILTIIYSLVLDINLDSLVQEVLLECLDALAAHLLVGGQPDQWEESNDSFDQSEATLPDQSDVVELGVPGRAVEAGRQRAQLGLRHCGSITIVNVQNLEQAEITFAATDSFIK